MEQEDGDMKVVQFRDGKYGVRKGLLFYRFRDMVHPWCWWSADSEYFRDCKTDDLEKARRLARPDCGKVVE